MKPASILFAASIAIISQSALADCSAELSARLVEAHAATVAAEARLEQILREKDDQFISETIVRLRNQYLDLAAHEQIYANRYGLVNPVVNLRAQMQEIRRKIDDEMIRIARSAKNDFEIARAREQSIRQALVECLDDSHPNLIIR